MQDVLIRDVPDDEVSASHAQAKRLGLSRTEYLRRQMQRVAPHPTSRSRSSRSASSPRPSPTWPIPRSWAGRGSDGLAHRQGGAGASRWCN